MNKKGAFGLREYVSLIVLIVLFTSFIFMFAGNYITATNPSSPVLDSKYKLNESIQSMNESLSEFSTISENVKTKLGDSTAESTSYIYLIFQGAFDIPKVFLDFVFNGFTSLTNILFPALTGTGWGSALAIVLGVIFSLVIVTIVFLIIYAIRTGVTER